MCVCEPKPNLTESKRSEERAMSEQFCKCFCATQISVSQVEQRQRDGEGERKRERKEGKRSNNPNYMTSNSHKTQFVVSGSSSSGHTFW